MRARVGDGLTPATRCPRRPLATPRPLTSAMPATRVHQHIRAPRALVYRLLLDPAALARWRVPDGALSGSSEVPIATGREVLPPCYPASLEGQARIQAARLTAATAVDGELIATYRETGRAFVEWREWAAWGATVIARPSADLRCALPGVRGFTERSFACARVSYLAYSRKTRVRAAIVQQAVAEPDARLDGAPLPARMP